MISTKQCVLIVSFISLLFFLSYLQGNLSSPINILLIGTAILAVVTSVFENKKIYNKNLYFISIFLLIFPMLVIYVWFIVNRGELSLYNFSLVIIFVLIIMWAVYATVRRLDSVNVGIREYDSDLKMDPDNITILNNKGVVLANLKEYQAAIECFDKVLELKSDDAVAWHNKGVVLDRIRKQDEAVKCYDKALSIDSKFDVSAREDGKILLEA